MIQHTWSGATATVFDLTDPDAAVVLLNEAVEGMGNPPLLSFTREAAQLDGQEISGWRAKPREVFWPIMINTSAANWTSTQRAWWATLRPNLYGRWTVTLDGQSRYLNCRYDDDSGSRYATDPSREGAEVHGISLIADDPWWHGVDVSRTFQTAETPLPFFAVTTDRVFNLMSSNTVANTTINNPGEVPVWLRYRFDGPITGFTIGYSSGVDPLLPNDNVTAPLTLAAGEYAILDTSPTKQSLLKYSASTVTDVTNLLEGASWAQVQPGSSQPLYVLLNGAGSMTATLSPLYYRAF